ncbi:hypothetical protein [Paenibacillus odorifer]|uniref:Uncharacterized protein n=1 Tax=Paenibacillus odorifer TaxID=189426 RepID=A0A1R0XAJ8_9BACL|nr:hypothetical protein [Paenibacillus odorifer]OMD31735.1 hypothetical protein BJP51_18100 [Paenibacillus odorifer]
MIRKNGSMIITKSRNLELLILIDLIMVIHGYFNHDVPNVFFRLYIPKWYWQVILSEKTQLFENS